MFNETITWLKQELNNTNELAQKTLEIEDKLSFIYYISSLVDVEMIQKVIIKPFFEMPTEDHFEAYLKSLPQQLDFQKQEEILTNLLSGSVLVALKDKFLILNLSKTHVDQVQQVNIEPTIHGSQLGFSEDLTTNINIIRNQYKQSSLTVELSSVGKLNKQKYALLYDKEKVNKTVLKKFRERISSVDKELIQSSSQLISHINNRAKLISYFPTTLLTERSDRTIYNIAGGKIIVLMEGSTLAIVAPAVFFDFMVSMEDNYHSFWISNFLRALRYVGLLVCILLPGLYVAVTSYSPEILRVELALTIAGSRVGVPYPPYIEVLFMLFFMELLVEASIRLPKAMSATATTVGGLILGTAATEANLTSNIMIIIISAVAISTFVIPINEMSFAVRTVRLALIIFASIFGLAGVVLAAIGFLMYLVNLNSFGEPYLRFYNYRKKNERGDVLNE
ncbi:spore germination protein [Ureibacillus manganicus]|uniref:Spore gernimation protein GerA n=1 Tax=Ureibacillus manganicus DSM 26584 TaxID=1384049 RepID=A0A0A3ITD4_9BACL|nr:spore germination protein [Ureibacillus manganicus]KGR78082.1 spore gernimation protein GerA [Ureibacillus manganicus DSM 26584]